MEKIDIVEKLNDEVEEKKEKIERLENELSHINDFHVNRWQHHKGVRLEKTDARNKLPLPRLEMIYSIKDYQIVWLYGLAFKPFWFLHGTGPDYIFLPFSRTISSGEDITNLEKQHTLLPFRDGLHIKHDSMILDLPMFFIHLNKNESVEIENDSKGHIANIIDNDKKET